MIDARDAAMRLVLGAVHHTGLGALAAPLLASSGAILMLHRVTAAACSPLGLNRGLAVSPSFLDRLLADLSRRGVRVVGLDELLEALGEGRARGLVALTADDGYLDNLMEALPVLEAHRAPVTIYVAPALVSGEVMPWWEAVENFVAVSNVVHMPAAAGTVRLDCPDEGSRRAAAARIMEHLKTRLPEEEQQAFLAKMGIEPPGERQFMDWSELRGLSRHPLVDIGAHTVHHYNLSRLSPEKALREMADSAALIERELGMRPRHLAYPYGGPSAVGLRESELARAAGFASAVTTRHGVLHRDHRRHLHALPRISVNGNFQTLSYMRALLSGVPTLLANRGRRLVTV